MRGDNQTVNLSGYNHMKILQVTRYGTTFEFFKEFFEIWIVGG